MQPRCRARRGREPPGRRDRRVHAMVVDPVVDDLHVAREGDRRPARRQLGNREPDQPAIGGRDHDVVRRVAADVADRKAERHPHRRQARGAVPQVLHADGDAVVVVPHADVVLVQRDELSLLGDREAGCSRRSQSEDVVLFGEIVARTEVPVLEVAEAPRDVQRIGDSRVEDADRVIRLGSAADQQRQLGAAHHREIGECSVLERRHRGQASHLMRVGGIRVEAETRDVSAGRQDPDAVGKRRSGRHQRHGWSDHQVLHAVLGVLAQDHELVPLLPTIRMRPCSVRQTISLPEWLESMSTICRRCGSFSSQSGRSIRQISWCRFVGSRTTMLR